MDLRTDEIPRFYFATVVPVELTAETAFPAGVYTFAVKSRRSVTDPLIALSTVTLAEAATTLSAILDFGTEKALAVSQTGDFEVWLEISTAGKVFFQQGAELLPRVYDGSTPAPTPVTLYYTKAEVDALIAGISGAVDSVNGQTGAVVLDAADVGAVATPVREALTSTTFVPAPLSVYTHTVAAGDVLDFGVPEGSVPVVFKLDLTIPDGVPSFSFAQTITWEGGSPDFSVAGVYQLYFEYDNGWRGWRRPDMSEYLPYNSPSFTGNIMIGDATHQPTISIGGGGGTNNTGITYGKAVGVAVKHRVFTLHATERGNQASITAAGNFRFYVAQTLNVVNPGDLQYNSNSKNTPGGFVIQGSGGELVLSGGTANDVIVYPHNQTSSSISLVDLAQRIAALEAAQE